MRIAQQREGRITNEVCGVDWLSIVDSNNAYSGFCVVNNISQGISHFTIVTLIGQKHTKK